MSKFFEYYFQTACVYGGIRKLAYTWNTKYTDDKGIESPILYTHRLVHMAFAGVSGIGFAPMHLINDVSRLEMYVREIPEKKSTITKNIDFYDVMLDTHPST